MTGVGLKLITEFEGYHANAYPDPLHGWNVPTIGYGTTRYSNGRKVQQGDVLNQEKAMAELAWHVDNKIRPYLQQIPGWEDMHDAMKGALESFAYNLGAHFYGSDGFGTISAKLRDRRWGEVPDALLLYRNPGTPVEAGLLRRRKAEGNAWYYGLKEKNWGKEFQPGDPYTTPHGTIKGELKLKVKYFSQRDSQIAGEADRTCFASTNAMLVKYLRPGALPDTDNADDIFVTYVNQGIRDTTRPADQLTALSHFGVRARFSTKLNWEDVDAQLDKHIPVPIGYLHHGHVSQPTGDGHWILIVGRTADRKGYFVHDPYGEGDMIHGGHNTSKSGAYLVYSRENLGRRWQVDGMGTGWGIIAEPVEANLVKEVTPSPPKAGMVAVHVTLDGQLLAEGFLDNGISFAPVAPLATAMDIDVKWDGPTRTVSLTRKP